LEYINGTKINAPYEKFSLIDDYRTVYDMAKLYQNELNNETVRGIEVPSNIVSEKTFIDTYQKFAKKSTGKYVLNTDSNELAASFIDRGSGILCYNGDNIYGAIGLGQVDYQNQLIKG
jgi:hypothetical protein